MDSFFTWILVCREKNREQDYNGAAFYFSRFRCKLQCHIWYLTYIEMNERKIYNPKKKHFFLLLLPTVVIFAKKKENCHLSFRWKPPFSCIIVDVSATNQVESTFFLCRPLFTAFYVPFSFIANMISRIVSVIDKWWSVLSLSLLSPEN